jgi:3-demethoxyubiquinol 3-hydroxylase
MRVNHVGEVCAQALYSGQALTTKNETVRVELEQAAREETDHLAWCETRINELGGRKSLLNPLWFGGAFGIGVAPACWATNGTSAFSPKPNARSKRTSTATCSSCRKPTPQPRRGRTDENRRSPPRPDRGRPWRRAAADAGEVAMRLAADVMRQTASRI